MPYIHVENFGGGLDDRKSIITAAPGTLAYCNNAHLTAGGEIEKRKAFVPFYRFPPDVKCLGGWAGVGTIWLWGNGVAPLNFPAGFTWVNVAQFDNPAVRLIRAQPWGATPYALVEYADGSRRLWNGSTLVDTGNTAVWNWPGLPFSGTQDMAVLDQKLYTCQGSILEASGVAEPEKHGASVTGSAVYDVGKFGPYAYDLLALAVYQNRMVSFGRNGAVVWQVDPDPDQTRPLQFLNNFGCAAPRSIVEYGEVDTFFLSHSGVRSIRARDSSNAATIVDVGTPINKTITAQMALLSAAGEVIRAVGAYEPRDGRYLLALYDVIYVLSYFPGARLNAWSTYTPGFVVRDMFTQGETLFVLSEDSLYTLGAYRGNAPSDYDRTVVEVELPYLNAGDPAAMKSWTGFDATVEGKWAAYAGFSLIEPGVDELTNILRGPTYDEGEHGLVGEGTHIKIRLKSDAEGYAKVSDLCIHYESESAS